MPMVSSVTPKKKKNEAHGQKFKYLDDEYDEGILGVILGGI